jgi:hypothetical protein
MFRGLSALSIAAILLSPTWSAAQETDDVPVPPVYVPEQDQDGVTSVPPATCQGLNCLPEQENPVLECEGQGCAPAPLDQDG